VGVQDCVNPLDMKQLQGMNLIASSPNIALTNECRDLAL
jgi:hypothetical protein